MLLAALVLIDPLSRLKQMPRWCLALNSLADPKLNFVPGMWKTEAFPNHPCISHVFSTLIDCSTNSVWTLLAGTLCFLTPHNVFVLLNARNLINFFFRAALQVQCSKSFCKISCRSLLYELNDKGLRHLCHTSNTYLAMAMSQWWSLCLSGDPYATVVKPMLQWWS